MFTDLRFSTRLVLFLLLVSIGIFSPPASIRAQSDDQITIGVSGQGRAITAVRFGNGPRKLVVVGDTHGGPERNTYQLTNQLIEYFRQHTDQVPADIRLYLIPTLNPDGLALGSRFNGRGVDLNRNMNTNLDSCAENDWNTTVQGAYGYVSDTGGPYPDSEVESRVIRQFLLDADAAIFIHSNAGLVFPAFCEFQPSIELAQVYAKGANYVYSRYWPNYLITGGMHDWASSLGIAAITPELVTGELSEFDQNLSGLQAVLADANELVLPPTDHVENNITVPALIWRFWKAYGGESRFGLPLGAAYKEGDIIRQPFTNAVLEIHPEAADTGMIVQPAPLGSEVAGKQFAPTSDNGSGRFFAETSHNVFGAFLNVWEQHDGARVYGLPISEELTITTIDGEQRPAQYFERALLTYYKENDTVQLAPLGWETIVSDGIRAPTQRFQFR